MTQLDLLARWAREHTHRHDPATSREAALGVHDKAQTHCDVIHRVLQSHKDGLTSFQISELILDPAIDYHEVARRIADLQRAGLAVDSKRQRRGPHASPSGRYATVWKVSE